MPGVRPKKRPGPLRRAKVWIMESSMSRVRLRRGFGWHEKTSPSFSRCTVLSGIFAVHYAMLNSLAKCLTGMQV